MKELHLLFSHPYDNRPCCSHCGEFDFMMVKQCPQIDWVSYFKEFPDQEELFNSIKDPKTQVGSMRTNDLTN
jgi:hypothetical protein